MVNRFSRSGISSPFAPKSRSKRSLRSRTSRNPLPIRFIALIIGACILLPGIGWAFTLVRNTLPESAGSCTAERTRVARLVITDYTDAIDARQQRRVEHLFTQHIPKDFRAGQYVYVQSLQGAGGVPLLPVFDGCSPQTGAEANGFLQTANLIQDEWEQTFGTPYRESFRLTQSPSFRRTPLLEAVESGYRDLLQRHPNLERVEIDFITDGLPHMSYVTIYGSSNSSKYILKPNMTERLLTDTPDMPKLSIRFHIIERYHLKDGSGRDMYPRQQRMMGWLEEFYTRLNVNSVTARPLPGDIS